MKECANCDKDLTNHTTVFKLPGNEELFCGEGCSAAWYPNYSQDKPLELPRSAVERLLPNLYIFGKETREAWPNDESNIFLANPPTNSESNQ